MLLKPPLNRSSLVCVAIGGEDGVSHELGGDAAHIAARVPGFLLLLLLLVCLWSCRRSYFLATGRRCCTWPLLALLLDLPRRRPSFPIHLLYWS